MRRLDVVHEKHLISGETLYTAGLHEKHFIPNIYNINIKREQLHLIGQSEKDAMPSIFDYPFHLAKHIDIVFSEVLLKLCCQQRKSIPEAKAE